MASFGKGPVEKNETLFRIAPYHYLHVLDQNTNVTRVEVGPKTFVRADHERVVYGPERMVTIPPRHYATIENPILRDKDARPVTDASGQVKLQHGDLEIRLAQEPFPLYPGETLKMGVTPLRVVLANTALHLKALLDFTEESGAKRVAGDEWLFEGPGTYIPRKEVTIEGTLKAMVVATNQALRLKARKELTDREGKARFTGEEWLIKKTGSYMAGPYEEVVGLVNAFVLTDKQALHLRAAKPFKDCFGVARKTGDQWLVTMKEADSHIPDVYEEVIGTVDVTTLNNRQYCIVLDPVDDQGKPQLGRKKVIRGEKSFFLMPGESLLSGIQDVYVLGENEGLILRASEAHYDEEEKVERKPGDRWMIRGPIEYVPTVSVEVLVKQAALPLDENEGIYVRNVKSGKVRAVSGSTYMLNQDEELWSKELPEAVENLLSLDRDPLAFRSEVQGIHQASYATARDKTRVVSYRVPHNAAVQIYDFKEKKARIVFGPELVMLDPDEQFTLLSLSGGKPKVPNAIKALCLLLGPDFFTDIATVETADHARLQIKLSYNWFFEVKNREDPKETARLFSVPDFVGDACKAVASRIRGAVASVTFDDFHKNSARIIRSSVFGFDDKGKVRDHFTFQQNNLVITNIDIQSVEPVDQRTRDALMKSVQLAIEITTSSQEATARHEAERVEQEAKGRLERQRITDQSEAEKARKELMEIQARAEATAHAEASRIEAESAVQQARLKAEAMKIEADSELDRLGAAREAELKYATSQAQLEVKRGRELADIEVEKFKRMVDAIGQGTLQAIATAGPEMQVRMLQSLGLKSTLITDGRTPINLIQAATGLIGMGGAVPPACPEPSPLALPPPK